jgi:outer membrane protein insertion porin family
MIFMIPRKLPISIALTVLLLGLSVAGCASRLTPNPQATPQAKAGQKTLEQLAEEVAAESPSDANHPSTEITQPQTVINKEDGNDTPLETTPDDSLIPTFDDSAFNSTGHEDTVIRGQSPVTDADFVELSNPSKVLRVDDSVQLAQAQDELAPNDNSVRPLFDPNAAMNTIPFDVYVEEGRTGRFMFGVGVNSDAGVTGQIVIDERNFDYQAVPESWEDFIEGRAFRGGGQGFRLEAMPGEFWERYMLQYSNPYFRDTKVSLNTSAFMYDRIYRDWDEKRAGGRLGFGYRLNPDLSVNMSVRLERIKITDPSISGVPDLDDALGYNDLVGLKVGLSHDTRDTPFLATEGYYFNSHFEQILGDYVYPRGGLEYRKYYLIRERADGSGRHVFSWRLQYDITGEDTPLYDHYFAGGYSTMRGFEFRGASPEENGVRVGGHQRLLGTLQYLFPFTADDMLKGVLFTDFGTVEQGYDIHSDNFRVVVGAGLRISMPFMSQAPFALDFGFPIHHADTDDKQVFSFYLGFSRG